MFPLCEISVNICHLCSSNCCQSNSVCVCLGGYMTLDGRLSVRKRDRVSSHWHAAIWAHLIHVSVAAERFHSMSCAAHSAPRRGHAPQRGMHPTSESVIQMSVAPCRGAGAPQPGATAARVPKRLSWLLNHVLCPHPSFCFYEYLPTFKKRDQFNLSGSFSSCTLPPH